MKKIFLMLLVLIGLVTMASCSLEDINGLLGVGGTVTEPVTNPVTEPVTDPVTEPVTNPEHVHNKTWVSDATNHWQACDGCEETFDLGEHTFTDWIPTDNNQESRSCSICMYREVRDVVEEGFYYEHSTSSGQLEIVDGVYSIELTFAIWNRVSFKYNGEYITIASATGAVSNGAGDGTVLYVDTVESTDYIFISNSAEEKVFKFTFNPETGVLNVELVVEEEPVVEGLVYGGTHVGTVEANADGNYVFELTLALWNRVSFTYNGTPLTVENTTISGLFNSTGAADWTDNLYNDGDLTMFISCSNGDTHYVFTYNPTANTLDIALKVEEPVVEGFTYSGTLSGVVEANAEGNYEVTLELAQWNRLSFTYNGVKLTVENATVTGMICSGPGADWTENMYYEADDLGLFFTCTGGNYVFTYNPTTNTLNIALKVEEPVVEGFYYEHTSGSGELEAVDGVYTIELAFKQWNRVSFKYNGEYITIDKTSGNIVDNYDASIGNLYIDAAEINDYTYLSSSATEVSYIFTFDPATGILNAKLVEEVEDPVLEGTMVVGGTFPQDIEAVDGVYTLEATFAAWNRFSLTIGETAITTENTTITGLFVNQADAPWDNRFYTEDGCTFIYSMSTPTTYIITYTAATKTLNIAEKVVEPVVEGFSYSGTLSGEVEANAEGNYEVLLELAIWNSVSFVYNGKSLTVENTTVTGLICSAPGADWTENMYYEADDLSKLFTCTGGNYVFTYNPTANTLNIALKVVEPVVEGFYYEHTSGSGELEAVDGVYTIELAFKQWNRVSFKYNGEYITIDKTSGNIVDNYDASIGNLYIDAAEINDYTYLSSSATEVSYIFTFDPATGILNAKLVEEVEDPVLEGTMVVGGTFPQDIEAVDGVYTLEATFATWNRFSLTIGETAITPENTTITGLFVNQADAPWDNRFYTEDGCTFIYSMSTPTTYIITYTAATKTLHIAEKVVEPVVEGFSYSGTLSGEVEANAEGNYEVLLELAKWNSVSFVYNGKSLTVENTTVTGLICSAPGADWTENMYYEADDLSKLFTCTGGNYVFTYNPTANTLNIALKVEEITYNTYYLRGDMNDWGITDVLVVDGTEASIEIVIKKTESFKVATEDWNVRAYGMSNGQIVTDAGAGNITVAVSGKYLIKVINLGQETETVTIELVEEIQDEEPEITYNTYYFRGGSFGWNDTNESNQLVVVDGVASIEVDIQKGAGFKIATADWKVAYGANSDGTYSTSGGDISLPVSGKYLVQVVNLGLENETLVIELIEASTEVVINTYYLRGDMNDWGATDVLTVNGSEASIEATILKGQEFKVATSDWSVAYGVTSTGAYAIGGNNVNISMAKSGVYLVKVVDLGLDSEALVIELVEEIQDEEPETPEVPATGMKVYLKPNSNWLQSNARFAVYGFGNSGDIWVDMTDSDGDGIYEAIIDVEVYPTIIFCRMNPNAAANNWNNKWNQTADLPISAAGTNNCYEVKANTWDKGGGTWSTVE